MLDINRFIKNITIRKHYLVSDIDIQDCVDTNTLHNNVSDGFYFHEHCSIKELTDLAAEGNSTGLSGVIVSEGLNRVKIKKSVSFLSH